MLQFQISNQTVEFSEAVNEEKAGGALQANHPKIVEGTWAANEEARTVQVDVGGVTNTYKLALPTNSQQCVLLVGSIDAADLSRSWFGIVDLSEDR